MSLKIAHKTLRNIAWVTSYVEEILRLVDALWSRDTCGLALPPNPTVTTAMTVVAPSDWLMRCGHVVYLGLGLAVESDGDDGEDGGGALRLVDALWSRDIPGAWPCRRIRR